MDPGIPDANTRAIIMLGWARLLGLDDNAFERARGRRIHHASDDADVVMFVRLFESSVLVGPPWVHEPARRLDDEQLASPRTLLQLSAHVPSARILGEATLAYLDSAIDHPDAETARVANDVDLAVALERSCPADDTAEATVSDATERFVLMVDDIPVAGAGYDEWSGLLAHIAVLTAPEHRRHGYGGLIAALAANDAFAAGLVPQWRARVDNRASRRLAETLGFAEVGTQTTVSLDG